MNRSQDNDAELYSRYVAGDDDAFVEIVTTYKDGLMAFAYGFVHDYGNAEDVVAEAFFKVAAKKARFKGKCAFKTWLFSIVRNEALTYLRKHRRVVVGFDEQECFAGQESSEYDNPEQVVLAAERDAELRAVLDELDGDYRHVLYLGYVEELSNAEIAAIMHKSPRQVTNLMYRAKGRLRERVAAGQAAEMDGRCS